MPTDTAGLMWQPEIGPMARRPLAVTEKAEGKAAIGRLTIGADAESRSETAEHDGATADEAQRGRAY